MRKIALLLTLILLPVLSRAELPFKPKDRILFLGDSITQNGAYVSLLETYFWAKYPEADWTIINIGVSGETVSGQNENPDRPRPWVHDRLDKALGISKPNWVFVNYGMNDGIYHPPTDKVQKAYEDELTKLIKKCQETGAKVILITPPPFDTKSRGKIVQPIDAEAFGYGKPYENYDDVLENFGKHIMGRKDVHAKIDLHTPVEAYIEASRKSDPKYRYGDGVHPPADGHLAFTLALLDAMGEDRNKAYGLLHFLTGIALVSESPKTLLYDDAKTLGSALLKRHRVLNSAYRKYVGRKGPAGDKAALDKAIERADALEEELKASIAQATRK